MILKIEAGELAHLSIGVTEDKTSGAHTVNVGATYKNDDGQITDAVMAFLFDGKTGRFSFGYIAKNARGTRAGGFITFDVALDCVNALLTMPWADDVMVVTPRGLEKQPRRVGMRALRALKCAIERGWGAECEQADEGGER